MIFLAVNQTTVCMIKLSMSIGCTHIYSPVVNSHYNSCYSDTGFTIRKITMNNVVFLPWPPKELSPNAALHWAKKSKKKKEYRTACWALTLEAQLEAPQGDERFPLEITFYPPDKRHRDADNMVAAIKSGLDGVADALKVNDRKFLPSFIFSEEVKGMIKVEIK